MDLGDEEQPERGPWEPGRQLDQPAEPFNEGPLNERRRHEDVGPGLVGLLLALARALVGASGHHQAMASFEQGEQLAGGRRDRAAQLRIGDGLERAEHIVRVLGTIRRDVTGHDDGLGLVDRELGAFDEVGEVRLEEGQRGFTLAR